MATMFFIIMCATIVGLWAAFILLLSYKLGVIEWMQVHGCKLISEMAHCNFCLSWWVCLILSIVALCFVGDLHIIAVPFIATPIARILL